MKNIEIAPVEAGLGSRFDHTRKLKVMKFEEVMNGPDSINRKKKLKMNTNKW